MKRFIKYIRNTRNNLLGSTLRIRLILLLILLLALIAGAGILIDYFRSYHENIKSRNASLKEQAYSILAARKAISDQRKFIQYIRDYCAHMDKHISPGHLIVILDSRGQVDAATIHQNNDEILDTIVASPAKNDILYAAHHKLLYLKLRDPDSAETVIVAQYILRR